MAFVSIADSSVVEYPSSDGQPMAESEVQGRQLVRLGTALETLFRGRDDVHVGWDLLWYPVEGRPDISRAPDVFVVPGRPADPPRSSWLQWEEAGMPMRHVVEIVSPSNSATEMAQKRRWYDRYGVEEYLVFHPEAGLLEVAVRTDLGLVPIDVGDRWTSSVLDGVGYRVDPPGPDDDGGVHQLVVLDPGGRPVESAAAAIERADALTDELDRAAARAERLEAKLREAGIDPSA